MCSRVVRATLTLLARENVCRVSTQSAAISELTVPEKGSWMKSSKGYTGMRLRRSPTELQRALTLIELQLAKGQVR